MDYEDAESGMKAIFTLLLAVGLVFGFKDCAGMVAKEQAELYNKKFETSYTEHQFYWGGSTIVKFHEKEIDERPKPYKLEIK